MGLVDYSESSGSEDEAPVKPPVAKPAPASASASTSKKPFKKVVDRSNPGKIVVNLPLAAKSENPKPSDDDEQPPAKRARTGGKGGLFSDFSSFLPPPKNTAKAAAPAQSSNSKSRPVFQLKTGAEPGFNRERGDDGGGLGLPPPKAAPQPTIPEGMKPAEEVKLVGKPMMFRPLSVSRKPKKKTPATVAPTAPKTEPATVKASEAKEMPPPAPAPVPAPKKVSLFSIEPEETPSDAATTTSSGAYEPLFETDQTADDSNGYYADHAQAHASYPAPTTAPTDSSSLDVIADDLNLSAAARRELFGRGGGPQTTASRVINFNTDEEYKRNEELRASGQQQIHNPVRSIAPGKHNLRQLVNAVQNQREALEESFAKGKNNRKEASSRYGW